MRIVYKLRYANRRTLSLKMDCDGNLTVGCPYGTTEEKISRFISDNEAWIERQRCKVLRSKAEHADLIEHRKILVSGCELKFAVGNGDFFDGESVAVSELKNLRKLYVENFSSYFLKIYEQTCLRSGLCAKSVKFKDYKSMWGCCDGKNNIVFNYKVLMLPTRLQIYVIVHELCHTVRHDHSIKFWEQVAKIMPDYKECAKALKEYAFITRLY